MVRTLALNINLKCCFAIFSDNINESQRSINTRETAGPIISGGVHKNPRWKFHGSMKSTLHLSVMSGSNFLLPFLSLNFDTHKITHTIVRGLFLSVNRASDGKNDSLNHVNEGDVNINDNSVINTNDSDSDMKYWENYNKLYSQIVLGDQDQHVIDQGGHDFSPYEHLTSATNEKHLTHTDSQGQASMVNVGNKPLSSRTAVAQAKVSLGRVAFDLVKENKMKKGDVLTTAQLAGIMAAKKTSDLIPLCHNITLNKVSVDLELDFDTCEVVITAVARTDGKTGVEMEALTAVTVAALTVYDMCKAVSHDMVIHSVQLISKTGGQRGDYIRTSS